MFIIFFILLHTSLTSLEWHKSVKKAYYQAHSEQKPIFIDVYADWCKYCKILQKEIYPSSKIKEKLENDFILLKINGDMFPNFKKKFSIFSYPSIVILDKNGVLIQKITGVSINHDYLLKKIKQAYKKKDKENNLLQEIKNDPNDLTNYHRLSIYYEEAQKPKKAVSILKDALSISSDNIDFKNKIYYKKCMIELEHNTLEKSLNCFKKYIKVFQKNSIIDSYYYVGILFFQNKNNKLAKEYFIKYLEQTNNKQKRENIQKFIKNNL